MIIAVERSFWRWLIPMKSLSFPRSLTLPASVRIYHLYFNCFCRFLHQILIVSIVSPPVGLSKEENNLLIKAAMKVNLMRWSWSWSWYRSLYIYIYMVMFGVLQKSLSTVEGMNSVMLTTLSPNVRKRVETLQEIQVRHLHDGFTSIIVVILQIYTYVSIFFFFSCAGRSWWSGIRLSRRVSCFGSEVRLVVCTIVHQGIFFKINLYLDRSSVLRSD